MIIGIIPARYGSTRFPGKPLADIAGKSMIQRVLEQARQAASLDKVVVATDDERIAEAVRRLGEDVVMTRTDHPSGTDRCWEAYDRLVAEGVVLADSDSVNYVINIQGDEPFIDPAQIDELAAILDGTVELATQMASVDSGELLHDPKEAKIIINAQDEALYFSRAAIPYVQGVAPEEWHKHHEFHRHVGLYAYRADILNAITQLPPSPLEQAESLEQLRWLEAGYRIKLVRTSYQTPTVDSPADIEKILRDSL
ncbi:3-deoxy-manno-octulosonate cytidylyltransferase [Spirosoma koreense]